MKQTSDSQKRSIFRSSMCLKCAVGMMLLGLIPSLGWGYSGGIGTLQIPYILSSADDLVKLGLTPKDYDKHFLITRDIDLEGNLFTQAVIAPYPENNVSFFDEDGQFTGTMNGNGHVIRNLTITGENHIGFFGVLSERAQIFGLGIEDANIVGTGRYTGMLAGHNDGRIFHCYASGTVLDVSTVGGLVGENEGSIENCFVTGSVSGRGQVAGLVGHHSSRSLLLNSYSTCWIQNEAGTTSLTGGLVGSPFGETLGSFWDTETSGISSDANDTGSPGGTGGGRCVRCLMNRALQCHSKIQ